MFTSNTVSKSLLDAVNGVMQEAKEEKAETKPESKEHEKGESKKHEKEEDEKKEKKEKGETVEEGVLDTVKSVVKTGAKAVIKGAVKGAKALGGPDDEGHRRDLQRKLGVPQTGRKPMATYNEDSAQFTLKDRLIEREMTKGEKEDREDIVQGMKKNTEYFKKKYGSRWEKVMNATATKKAMGEEVEIEEHTTDTLAGRVAGGVSNDFKSFKSRLMGRGEPTAPTKEEPSNVNKASIAAHGGAVPSPKIGVAEELAAFVETEQFDQLEEEQKQRIIDFLQQEGWDEMLKSVKEKGEPKPNGGSGVKKGSSYGGSKQTNDKDEDEKKKK